jgi:hypothetical protein
MCRSGSAIGKRSRFDWSQECEGSATLTQAPLLISPEGIGWRRPERTWHLWTAPQIWYDARH